jgi:predicted amidohydrolase YtcJ
MRKAVLLYNGLIYTMDPQQPRATALLIEGERLLAVGGEELRDMAAPGTPAENLEGRCVLPGLTDSHIHFASFALGLQWVDLTGTASLQEALARVAQRAANTPPGEWVLGRGWNQEEWDVPRFPCANDLDRASAHHPVLLVAKSGHAMVVNSMALEKASITAETPDPPGGQIARDEAGRPTGLLLEDGAMRLAFDLIPRADGAATAAAIAIATAQAHRVGLTAIHEMDDQVAFDAFQRLRAEDKLGLRVVKYLPAEALDHALALCLRAGLGDDWLRMGGIKLFCRRRAGALTRRPCWNRTRESRTTAASSPWSSRHWKRSRRRATAGGLPLAIHAIGDRANRAVLDALCCRKGQPAQPHLRHRIEHVQVIHPNDLEPSRCSGSGRLDAAHHAPQDAVMADRHWGDRERHRLRLAQPARRRDGVGLWFRLSGGGPQSLPGHPRRGDTRRAPTATAAPLAGTPSSGSPSRRPCAPTRGAPPTPPGWKKRLGSLSAGKLADLVVLDRDIFTCDPAAIAETRVARVMIGGAWVMG